MIKIISKYDDNSSLDFLATKCNYEVVISTIDDTTQSTICDGKDAGLKALEVIDQYKLLSDSNPPFPFIESTIVKYLAPLINKIGL